MPGVRLSALKHLRASLTEALFGPGTLAAQTRTCASTLVNNDEHVVTLAGLAPVAHVELRSRTGQGPERLGPAFGVPHNTHWL